MTPTDLWTLLIVGAIIGWYIGRRHAENKRTRFDMNNVWDNRQDYRKGQKRAAPLKGSIRVS
jgi:lipopolysaccharide biosynthesis regulator YciM